MSMHDFRPSDKVAVMLLTMILAALWQHAAMDHISPMNEATDFAGTASQLRSTSARSLRLAAHTFASLDLVTLNLNALRSTMVPSARIACLGKNEHLTIFSDNPSVAASKTMRMESFMAASKRAWTPRTSSM